MRRYLSEKHIRENSPVIQQQGDPSLGRLMAVVKELTGLTEIPLFIAVERVLTDLGNANQYTNDEIEAIRKLRIWRADYLRLIAELDVATRSLHLIERRLGQRIDAALADWERRFGEATPGIPEQPAIAGRQGWFPGFRRRRQAQVPSAALKEDSSREQRDFTTGLPLVHGPVRPPPEPYDADIAARVLGPLELSVAGTHVPKWGSLKARAIFQYLLIHYDRPVRREVLMELEWPDHSHNSARNNLNVALYSLRNTLDRRGLAARAIVHREGCYLLNPALACWIDRNEFLSLVHNASLARREGNTQQAVDACRSAVELYRGALFEDDLSGEWYLPERRQLKELNLQALEYLAETYCDRGQFSMAAGFGQHVISIDPCYEAAHRLLMRCYAGQHQQQLVNRQYQLCAAALRDELDVSPAAETVRLFRSLTSTA